MNESDTDDRTIEEIDLARSIYTGLERQPGREIERRRQQLSPFQGGGYTITDVSVAWKPPDPAEYRKGLISRFDNKTAMVMYAHSGKLNDSIGTLSKEWNSAVDGIFQQVLVVVVSNPNSTFNVFES